MYTKSKKASADKQPQPVIHVHVPQPTAAAVVAEANAEKNDLFGVRKNLEGVWNGPGWGKRLENGLELGLKVGGGVGAAMLARSKYAEWTAAGASIGEQDDYE